MFETQDWMWSMHGGWWIVWIVLTVLILVLLLRRDTPSRQRKSPLDILEDRYARGEIATDDYEERRERLLRDRR